MQLSIDLRPRKLSEVHGHPLIVKSIYNRAKENNWPTATLLKGFSGTGKSTICSILATMMNCKSPKENGDACLECPSCLSVLEKRFDRDIQRLDGGTSNKDDVIDFTSLISSIPFYDSNRSIYIIEEADQLSTKAMNALLTILETPQNNVHFILLSMQPKGIELPNSSRCQTYHFSPFMMKDILLGLQKDLKKINKWGVPEIPKTFYTEVIPAIASASSGSYRKALQDTESCLFGEAWTTDEYVELTGVMDTQTALDTLLELLGRRKSFFSTVEKMSNFSEFFTRSHDMLSKAYVFKKTGIINVHEFFQDEVKQVASYEKMEEVLSLFDKVYEINPSYIKKSMFLSQVARSY